MIRDHVLYDLIAPQELSMILNHGFWCSVDIAIVFNVDRKKTSTSKHHFDYANITDIYNESIIFHEMLCIKAKFISKNEKSISIKSGRLFISMRFETFAYISSMLFGNAVQCKDIFLLWINNIYLYFVFSKRCLRCAYLIDVKTTPPWEFLNGIQINVIYLVRKNWKEEREKNCQRTNCFGGNTNIFCH